jgi:hypothetical protein
MTATATEPAYIQEPLLDMQPLVKAEGATIQERFESFHQQNPWVLVALERLARQWLDNGHSRVGAKMLTERLRWEYGVRTRGDAFRLNNSYTSRFVRLMIQRHPEWAKAFETRTLRSG